MVERLCEYANCHSTDITVTVNRRLMMDRPAFCSEEHAALFFLEKVLRRDHWPLFREIEAKVLTLSPVATD